MGRGWRVLDATDLDGTVAAARGCLRVTPANGGGAVEEVPAAEVAVLLIGGRASLHSSLVHAVDKYDLAVLTVDWRGVPTSGLYPWREHGRVAARHIAQAGLSIPRKKNAWMQLVKAKVRGQAATLRSVGADGHEELVALAARVRSGDIGNLEAAAARAYWRRLFERVGRGFRRDQDAPDNLNAQLNYGYMVLRGYGVRAVLSAGLSPPLGVFHHGRQNYFNLVDDLIEPFRPAVDLAVAGLGPDASLGDRATKAVLVAAATQHFTAEGYRIPSVLTDLAQQYGRYAEGEVERLTVPAWQGPRSDDARIAASKTPVAEAELGDETDAAW